MSTEKQKGLAKAIVINAKNKNPKNAGELLESAGYDETTAKASPGRTIKQKGVQKELKKLGFTEQKAKEVVAQILGDSGVDPSARLKAADIVFKVNGSYAPEKSLNVNVNINPENAQQLKGLAKQVAQEIKKGYEETND